MSVNANRSVEGVTLVGQHNKHPVKASRFPLSPNEALILPGRELWPPGFFETQPRIVESDLSLLLRDIGDHLVRMSARQKLFVRFELCGFVLKRLCGVILSLATPPPTQKSINPQKQTKLL